MKNYNFNLNEVLNPADLHPSFSHEAPAGNPATGTARIRYSQNSFILRDEKIKKLALHWSLDAGRKCVSVLSIDNSGRILNCSDVLHEMDYPFPDRVRKLITPLLVNHASSAIILIRIPYNHDIEYCARDHQDYLRYLNSILETMGIYLQHYLIISSRKVYSISTNKYL